MKISFFLSLMLLTLAGCSGSLTVVPDAPADSREVVDYHYINTRINDRTVTMTLMNGMPFEADSVRIEPDSTSFLTAEGQAVRISTRTLCMIESRNRGAGAMEGFVLGLCGGGLFSYGLGYSLWGEEQDDMWRAIPLYGTTVLGAVLGSIGGVVQGAVHGHRTAYIFKQPSK